MSLTRVLEPEVMDTWEEARDYDRMDHSQVNQRFVAELLSAGFTGGDVLDVGTGTAQIPIELCRQFLGSNPSNRMRVMAIDLAVSMLELGRYNLEIAGFRESVQLARVDAKQMPYSSGMFDAVISNSIIHHIPEPIAVFRECWRVIRPGGLIFVRDLLRPADRPGVEHLVGTYAGQENSHSQEMFRASLCAALSLSEVRERVAAAGGQPQNVQPTSDRHWTWQERRT